MKPKKTALGTGLLLGFLAVGLFLKAFFYDLGAIAEYPFMFEQYVTDLILGLVIIILSLTNLYQWDQAVKKAESALPRSDALRRKADRYFLTAAGLFMFGIILCGISYPSIHVTTVQWGIALVAISLGIVLRGFVIYKSARRRISGQGI